MQGNVITTPVTRESVERARATMPLPYTQVLKNGIKIESPSPITFKRRIGNPFLKRTVLPANSLITLPNGNQFRIQGQCEFDFVSGYGMMCPGGYVMF